MDITHKLRYTCLFRGGDMCMIEELINEIREFAVNNDTIESVIMVGSYARGTNTETSDLDLCLITTNKSEMVEDTSFCDIFGRVDKKQVEYYGACTSVRVWYESGLEVEFGLVEPSWISQPLDDGTRKVLRDGYKVIVDKKYYFQNLESCV